MGIFDFREIRSPNRSHKIGMNIPLGMSDLPDDFELFAQEFFGIVRRMRIFKSVSNGTDGGIDLGVEETSEGKSIRWLVSCKHWAHSNTPVSEHEEKNILERLYAWECDGFIPFYTTPPSTKVETLISGVEKSGKRVERYFKDRIERELLESPVGTKIAARYFPKSMTNHYGKFIETLAPYSAEDVAIKDGIATIARFSSSVSGATDSQLSIIKSHLANDANLLATMNHHKPYFINALRDAIALAPDFFDTKHPHNPQEDSTNAVPTWNSYQLYRSSVQSLAFTYFVAAVWSFWDWSRSNQVFAEMMAFRSEPIAGHELSSDEIRALTETDDFKSSVEFNKAMGLLTPGLLGLKLPEKTRDIVARLFAFTNVIR